jgi:hypothetical protein
MARMLSAVLTFKHVSGIYWTFLRNYRFKVLPDLKKAVLSFVRDYWILENIISTRSRLGKSFFIIYYNLLIFSNPDSLENTAWLSLVKAMKQRKEIKNPYEAARKYLPPNSSINCPFEK